MPMHGQRAYLVIALGLGPGLLSAADPARVGEHVASATLEIRLPNLAGGPAGTLPRGVAAALGRPGGDGDGGLSGNERVLSVIDRTKRTAPEVALP
jgi:hypothetical protein